MTLNFENVKAATRWAYNEETRQLDFRAESVVTVDEAVEIMTEALELDAAEDLGYGEFAPSLLRALPMGTMVLLAREGSVCVYVQVPEGEKFTRLDGIRTMCADEFTSHEDAPNRVPVGMIRLWWD